MNKLFKQTAFLKALLLTAILAGVFTRAQAQEVVMGMSNSFGVLAGSDVSSTASAGSVIGDVGVSPGSSITLGGTVVTGGIYSAIPPAVIGETNAQTAYNQLAGFAVSLGGVLTGQDLGGKVLAPGVYFFSSSAELTGVLTLSGAGQYVFQIGSTLTTASGASINLINGADASDVFFQVGSSATLGTGTSFQGTIISFASDTVTTGSTVNGHVVALNGAVTLDANAITTTTNLIVNATTFNLGASTDEPVSVVTLSNAGLILGSGTSELINTGNYNLQNGTVTAILSGTGSALNKTTNGTVTLSGADTYTGPTTISAGTLAATNVAGSATGTGAVTVISGATLSGNGTVSNVTVNAGGILAPGTNGVGNLTMSTLSLASNSVTQLQFNLTPANTQLTVTGNNGLTLSNGAILDIYQTGTTTPFITLGTYQLIGFNGSITGTPSGLTFGATTSGLSFNVSAVGNFLDLTIAVAGGPGSWSATGSGNWSNTADWTSGVVASGANNTAVFGTSITAPATVTLDGNETVGGLTFGDSNSYTIAPGTGVLTLDNSGNTAVIAVSLGNQVISAPIMLTAGGATAQVSVGTGLTISGNIGQNTTAGLTKAGLGILTLSGVNTYTGDTVVTGGTLTDGVSNAIPSASNLTVNGTTAVFNLGANQTNTVNIVTLDGNGSILGTGNSTLTSTGGFQLMNGTVTAILAGVGIPLNKTTNGTVTLAGANTFTGPTTVSAGTLVLSPTGSLATTDTVNVAAGAVLTVDNNGTVAVLNTNGLINGNSTLTATTYNLNDGSQINTSLGNGTVISNGNVGVNGTIASTNISIQTGTMTLQAPNLLSPNATANISTGAALALGNGSASILNLDGNGTVNDINGILNVVDGFGSFNGTVTGGTSTDGALTSNGNLTIGLGTTDAYPNGTTITGGTLTVNGTLISPTTTVAVGGTLSGSGTITGNVINNGIVSPSDPSIMTISGNFNENGVLDIEIGGTAGPGVNPNGNDEIVVGGFTIINPVGSTLNLQSVNGFTSPTRGESFSILSGAAGSISGHFASITTPGFLTDLLVDLPTGRVLATGTAPGSSLATNFPGANASQLAQLSQLQVAPNQFVGGDLLQLLLTNPSSSTSQIFNESSPEAYAGLTDYALRTTQSYLKTALTLDPLVTNGKYEVFAGYNYYSGGSDSSQNQADYDLDSNGGVVGFRAEVNPKVFLGVFAGFDTGSVKSTYLNSNDTGFVGGLYATYDPLASHRLLGTASFTYGDYTSHGTRSTFSGASNFSGVDSRDYLGSLDVQYVAIKDPKYSITPEIDLNYSNANVDSFTESNASALEALQVNGQNTPSFRPEVAVNGQYNLTNQVGLTGRFGISHDFEDTDRDVTANIVGETTATTVEAPGMGDTEYDVGIGTFYSPIKGLRLQINYTAGFSTQSKVSNNLSLGCSYSW